MLTEDAKLSQINFITQTYSNIMSTFKIKNAVQQFYDGHQVNATNMLAQTNLGVESIVKQKKTLKMLISKEIK